MSEAPAPPISAVLEEAELAERSGRRSDARNCYEMLLRRIGEGEAISSSTLLRRIARTYVDDGQIDVAMDCLSAALAVAEAFGDALEIAHTLNLMANASVSRGEFEQAEALFPQAQEVAMRAGDRALQAMISQNLGVIASIRGDLNGALAHFRKGLATYRDAGLSTYVSGVLNNIGLVLAQLERLDEAQAAYDEALASCDATGNTANRPLILANSAAIWLARKDLDRADALCVRLIAEAEAGAHERAIGEAHRHRGVIARTRGMYDEAESHLAAAYANAMRREDLMLAAEAAREQAELCEEVGRPRDMLEALTRSLGIFTKLRAQRRLADLQQRVDRLEANFYLVVRRWAETIESKDSYTLGHCERVADYACILARAAGMDEITMFWFRIGALLHDVGKTAVPSEVLNKPGPLNEEERLIMERHPVAGSELLANIEFPWDILPVVRNHHERWDGAGYPDRLCGEDIPLAARIVCIADVYDALTTDRPYRPAFSREHALEIMAADAGRAFDSELFSMFERVMLGNDLDNRPKPASAVA